MEQLQFFIRHNTRFLHDKFILVFKSNEARDYFKQALKDCRFEEVTSMQAQHAARIGIQGKVVPYGYTYKLTDYEMKQLDVAHWDRTASLLAEGNERMYEAAMKRGEQNL